MVKLPFAKCDNCPLQEYDCVPPHGVGNPEILFVGESPGREELATGKPFMGDSGTILHHARKAAGIEQFGVTNIVPCEPVYAKGGDVEKVAIEACRERLEYEIATGKPKLIVAMGNPALHALTDTRDGIVKSHGRLVRGKYGLTLCLVHPAYILYQTREGRDGPGLFVSFNEYLEAAATFIRTGTIPTPKVYSSIKELGSGALGVDTENRPDGSIITIAIADAEGACVLEWDKLSTKELEALREFLNSRECVYHNALFDVFWLARAGFDIPIDYDTMLERHVLDENSKALALKKLATMMLCVPDWSQEIVPHIGKDHDYSTIPMDKLVPYTARDAFYTRRLHDLQMPRMTVGDRFIYDNISMPLSRVLNRVRVRGIPVDRARIMELAAQYEKELDDLRWPLKDIVGNVHFNPNAPGQVKEYILSQSIYADSTDEDALKAILRDHPDFEFAKWMLKFRELTKKLGTYVHGLAKHVWTDGCVRPNFWIPGTATGRLSASDPSVLNIDKDEEIRSMFPPRWGEQMGSADESGFELRVYAFLNNEERLLEIFKRGGDPHTEVCVEMYGEVYNEWGKQYEPWGAIGGCNATGCGVGGNVALEASLRSGGNAPILGLACRVCGRGYCELHFEVHEATEKDKKRRVEKENFFGRLYNLSIAALAAKEGTSLEEAFKLAEVIAQFIPGKPRWDAYVEKCIKDKGYVESPLGRRRRFPLLTGDNWQGCLNQGVNAPIQTTASDLNLLGFIAAESVSNVWLHYPVHDSTTFEFTGLEAARKVQEVMLATALRHMGMDFEVKLEAGPHLGAMRKVAN